LNGKTTFGAVAAPQVASVAGALQEPGLAPALESTMPAATAAPATPRALNQIRIDKTRRAYPGGSDRSRDSPSSSGEAPLLRAFHERLA
jgi:hypothetical protein